MTAALGRTLNRNPRTAGNEDTSLLKLIALFFMIIDHVGAALLPQYGDMRLVGRIAFPLYIWCAVVGVSYTRSIWKYALRVLLVGIIAQPCYMLALGHQWNQFNVFATLLLGILGAAGMREKKFFSHIWAPILAIAASLFLDMDYGWKGVLLILLMFAARESRGGIAAVMIAYCLFWGEDTYNVRTIFGMPVPHGIVPFSETFSFLTAVTRIQFFAILSLPLIYFKTHSGFHMPKWVGYAVYPGHLLVIGIIVHYNEIASAVSAFFSALF